jgi:hypothetical protein
MSVAWVMMSSPAWGILRVMKTRCLLMVELGFMIRYIDPLMNSGAKMTNRLKPVAWIMFKFRVWIVIGLFCFVTACERPSGVIVPETPVPATAKVAVSATMTPPPQPTLLPTETPSPTKTPLPPLTLAGLQNGTYPFESGNAGTFTLLNSTFRNDNLTITMLDQMAFGDLDGDGSEDAGIILTTRTNGGAEFSRPYAVLNRGIAPLPIAGEPLFDQTQIQHLAIENGAIFVDLLTFTPQDPDCCPSERSRAMFLVQNGSLIAGDYAIAPLRVLKPENVSLDLGDIASTIQLSKIPLQPLAEVVVGGNFPPSNLRFQFDDDELSDSWQASERQLLVLGMDFYQRQYLGQAHPVWDLRRLLETKVLADFPLLPIMPAVSAQPLYQQQAKFLNFQNGDGIRYITAYGDNIPFYTFQGLTFDRNYYVSFHYPIGSIADANPTLDTLDAIIRTLLVTTP